MEISFGFGAYYFCFIGCNAGSVPVEVTAERVPTHRVGLARDHVREEIEWYFGRRNGFGEDHTDHSSARAFGLRKRYVRKTSLTKYPTHTAQNLPSDDRCVLKV